jgi:hypothetical protein
MDPDAAGGRLSLQGGATSGEHNGETGCQPVFYFKTVIAHFPWFGTVHFIAFYRSSSIPAALPRQLSRMLSFNGALYPYQQEDCNEISI